MTDAASQPSHLLAIDLAAVPDLAAGAWPRFVDRLWGLRSETVLVYLDGVDFGSLPEPDYRIDVASGAVIRVPASDRLSELPVVEEASIGDGIAHLAAELLIPPSQVFVLLGADRAEGAGPGTILVGRDIPPDTELAVAEPTEDALLDALREAGYLGRRRASAPDVCDLAFEAAIDVVRRNMHDLGFTAASTSANVLAAHDANYAAVWARDAVITGLGILCLEDDELTACFERSLRNLAKHQTPAGQIPINLRIDDGRPDYSGIGGIAGIDAVLWFVIGAVRLALHTGDTTLAKDMIGPVERAMTWLAAHDSNNNGLIEIPESSDWMDLFPRTYNVLYDEVLWYEACLHAATLIRELGGDGDHWDDTAARVREQIIDKFWPTGEQLIELAGSTSGTFSAGEGNYFLSQITPFDYGWRCDVYANLLAALSGLVDEQRGKRLFTFLWGVGVNLPYPVTALYPPIQSGADDWKDYFLVNFLNLPGHYHNGGIWPFIGGMWVRYLVHIGRVELAHRELIGLAEACRQGIDSEWEFNEWLHGTTGRPMGKAEQAWSAASYIHAYLTLYGDAPAEMFPAL